MIDLSFVWGKKIGVVGLGKTGLASLQALRANGADVTAWDDDEAKRAEAAQNGIPFIDLAKQKPDFLLWSPGIAHYGPKANSLALKAKEQGISFVCDIDLFAQAVTNDILAITGTNGKSTTTALTGHILSQFRPVQVGGNIGRAVLDLEQLQGNGSYVLELSSYQLELSPHLKPTGAVLLNITPDHLARHGDMETYKAAKQNIFATDNTRKQIAVICIDSHAARDIVEKLEAERQWTVIKVSTREAIADGVHVTDGKLYDKGIFIFDLSEAPSLKGRHNHENAACAYALIRYLYPYDAVAIADAMKSFGGLPHRQYLIRTINGVAYINDSKATNADATSHALACTNTVYWILGGQSKEGGLNGLEPYMDRVRHAFAIGEAADDFSNWLKAHNVPVTISGTLDKAVDAAHKMAQNENLGGTVLLSPACASWDQFQSFEHRGDSFTQLVQNLSGGTTP